MDENKDYTQKSESFSSLHSCLVATTLSFINSGTDSSSDSTPDFLVHVDNDVSFQTIKEFFSLPIFSGRVLVTNNGTFGWGNSESIFYPELAHHFPNKTIVITHDKGKEANEQKNKFLQQVLTLRVSNNQPIILKKMLGRLFATPNFKDLSKIINHISNIRVDQKRVIYNLKDGKAKQVELSRKSITS